MTDQIEDSPRLRGDKRVPLSLRIRPSTKLLIENLTAQLGLSQTATVETALTVLAMIQKDDHLMRLVKALSYHSDPHSILLEGSILVRFSETEEVRIKTPAFSDVVAIVKRIETKIDKLLAEQTNDSQP